MEEEQLRQLIETGIKEAHFAGLQSGKKETSDLVDMIIHKMEPMIDSSVEKSTAVYIPKYVNGHLVEIKKTLAQQDKVLNSIVDEQSKVKTALGIAETITNPILKFKQFFGIIFSGIVSLGGFIKGLGALILTVGAVLALFKWIK